MTYSKEHKRRAVAATPMYSTQALRVSRGRFRQSGPASDSTGPKFDSTLDNERFTSQAGRPNAQLFLFYGPQANLRFSTLINVLYDSDET